MSNSLKISADTSPAKKSILDLGKSLKDLKGSKVNIFSSEEKRFIKTELKQEMSAMKHRIKENSKELSKMVGEQSKMITGTQEELELRKKILEAYKTQAKLGKQLGNLQTGSKSMGGGIGNSLAGGGSGIGGMIAKFIGGAALGIAAMGIAKTFQATGQYVGGAGQRNRLKGLGVGEDSFGSAQGMARVGLTEQDMIQRRIEATSVLGRQGTNNDTEMRKAGFERAFGLEGGTMTGIAGSMRGQLGGEGATDVQMKLQASIMAAGIEDAIGPYLQTAVGLLTAINEHGTANTSEMLAMMAQLTKDGQRTPELMSKAFSTVNSAIKGASGEQSAFLQTAFAKAGIGGGTLGGTKFAMSSGGLMGLNKDELMKRGYNPELLKSLEGKGMFSGLGDRTNAVMNQFKSSGGMKQSDKFSGMTDANKMIPMNNLANSVFGTQGEQGFDVLQMLEKVQNKQMTQKQFDKKLKDMQSSNDPVASRLDDINKTLSGQTQILSDINTNLMETLGKKGAVGRNELVGLENEGVKSAGDLVGSINDSGATTGIGGALKKGVGYLKGGLADSIYDMDSGDDQRRLDKQGQAQMKSLRSWHRQNKERAAQGLAPLAAPDSAGNFPTAKEIGKEVATALRENPSTIKNVLNTKSVHPNGSITEKTNK